MGKMLNEENLCNGDNAGGITTGNCPCCNIIRDEIEKALKKKTSDKSHRS